MISYAFAVKSTILSAMAARACRASVDTLMQCEAGAMTDVMKGLEGHGQKSETDQRRSPVHHVTSPVSRLMS